MPEWSKGVVLRTTKRKFAWVRTPLLAFFLINFNLNSINQLTKLFNLPSLVAYARLIHHFQSLLQFLSQLKLASILNTLLVWNWCIVLKIKVKYTRLVNHWQLSILNWVHFNHAVWTHFYLSFNRHFISTINMMILFLRIVNKQTSFLYDALFLFSSHWLAHEVKNLLVLFWYPLDRNQLVNKINKTFLFWCFLS